MTPVLEVRGVGKAFSSGGFFRRETTVALKDFSLTIDADRPTISAIAGESGSGKTTLARLLLGIIAPSMGEVLYQGVDLKTMNPRQRKQFRQEVQAVFQDPFEVYNPFYHVDHVLTTPITKFGLAQSQTEARDLIESALRKVGLRPEETLGRYPHQLSGGQRQRIMIARALLLQPKVIIADEPVSMVDASLRATILEALLKLNQEFGISLIYITHDLTTAYQLCSDIHILYRGLVAEKGGVEQVIKQPKHPYTQLLVGSIPLPNPDLRWGGEVPTTSERNLGGGQGCPFAPRCPHVMERCHVAPPPLYLTSADSAAACYLYDETPLAGTEVPAILNSSR
jgi:peptide/nickel transport system ATP-binding protein